ncbi:hypothetical protein [Paraliobacillus salinarum]|nr:hypothetical protein [Paraliobacillus salinarum]
MKGIDRESIIQELSLIKGYSAEVFEKLTDEQLLKELNNVYKAGD